jgi:O-antigen/teichoic acid export membrane protein
LNFDKSIDPRDYGKTARENIESVNDEFLGPGFLLFIDQLLVAMGNWVYWLIVFGLTSTFEVGQATIIYSLVLLTSLLTQLGLEYPLLKKSSTPQGSKILGTALLVELIITLASVPIMIYLINNQFHQSLHEFASIAVAILIFSSISFVTRFALLGVAKTKTVLLIDLTSIVLKFITGYALISVGLGALGLLLSFMFQSAFLTTATLVVAKRIFGFGLGNARYIKEIIGDALVNTPSKLSRMLMLSFSVVLLASFGISSSEISFFYLAFMISIVIGSLSSSMSFMVLPASAVSKADLSSDSLRVGLSFTAPMIVAVIVAPKLILSVIGPQYILAETILLVLSIAIVPSSIVLNTISRFNNLNKSRKLVLTGSTQIAMFLGSFVYLVPTYGTLGAAFSVLISFVAASIPSIIWSERELIRYIACSCAAIIAGTAVGFTISFVDGIHPIITILSSSSVTLTLVIVLKNTSIAEIRKLVEPIMTIGKR